MLTAREKIGRFDPFCHIAVMTRVFEHDYAFRELEDGPLVVLSFAPTMRAGAATDDIPLPSRKAIEIYSRKAPPEALLIGRIDIAKIERVPWPLGFDAGDGTEQSGGWPLGGRLQPSLGSEAVHAWRSIHDRKLWLEEGAAARASHEAMLVRLAAEAKAKRAKAKQPKTKPPKQ